MSYEINIQEASNEKLLLGFEGLSYRINLLEHFHLHPGEDYILELSEIRRELLKRLNKQEVK